MRSLAFAFSIVAFLCAIVVSTLDVGACTNTSNSTCCSGSVNSVNWRTPPTNPNPITDDGSDEFETTWQLDFCTTSDLGVGSFVASNPVNVDDEDVTPDVWTPGDCSGHHCCTITGTLTDNDGGSLDILGYVGNPTYPFSDTDTLNIDD